MVFMPTMCFYAVMYMVCFHFIEEFFVISRSRCIRWRRGSSRVTPPNPALLTHREDFTLLMSWALTHAG